MRSSTKTPKQCHGEQKSWPVVTVILYVLVASDREKPRVRPAESHKQPSSLASNAARKRVVENHSISEKVFVKMNFIKDLSLDKIQNLAEDA